MENAMGRERKDERFGVTCVRRDEEGVREMRWAWAREINRKRERWEMEKEVR